MKKGKFLFAVVTGSRGRHLAKEGSDVDYRAVVMHDLVDVLGHKVALNADFDHYGQHGYGDDAKTVEFFKWLGHVEAGSPEHYEWLWSRFYENPLPYEHGDDFLRQLVSLAPRMWSMKMVFKLLGGAKEQMKRSLRIRERLLGMNLSDRELLAEMSQVEESNKLACDAWRRLFVAYHLVWFAQTDSAKWSGVYTTHAEHQSSPVTKMISSEWLDNFGVKTSSSSMFVTNFSDPVMSQLGLLGTGFDDNVTAFGEYLRLLRNGHALPQYSRFDAKMEQTTEMAEDAKKVLGTKKNDKKYLSLFRELRQLAVDHLQDGTKG